MLFRKQIYIRLSDDLTDFTYTVKYGRWSLPPRRVAVARSVDLLPTERPSGIGVPVRTEIHRTAESAHRKEQVS